MQWRPPLADELFDMRFANVIAHFPKAKPVITHLLPKVGERVNVEHVLEDLQAQAAAGDKERYRQLAAVQFYLQGMLTQCTWQWADSTNGVTKGVTNYGTLIDEVRRLREPVCLVTFNYDTLLEKALETFGIRISAMSDYVATDYKVIKIHGSVNWAHEVMAKIDNIRGRDQLSIASEIIERRPELVISREYEIVYPTRTEIDNGFPIAKSREKALLPALAVPVENKPEDEIPPEHRKVLDDCLPQVTKILVIGWRAGESRFLTTLAGALKGHPKFMIVSRTEASANQVVIKVNEKLRGANVLSDSFKVSKGGFTSAIRNRETETFIHN